MLLVTKLVGRFSFLKDRFSCSRGEFASTSNCAGGGEEEQSTEHKGVTAENSDLRPLRRGVMPGYNLQRGLASGDGSFGRGQTEGGALNVPADVDNVHSSRQAPRSCAAIIT